MRTTLVLSFIITIAYARQGFGPGKQDWGYVTVRPTAHMFWWLYETTANVSNITERPLVIWLQGGPGESSTGIGNFLELGPIDLDLNPRYHTWVKDVNVLFIDNPVGAGYSYAEQSSAFATTNEQVADDLVACLSGFYGRHPEFQTVPLYIASEAYGGKMAVEFALKLNQATKSGKINSNLKGLSLIDPWISPIHSVLNWVPYLYHVGQINQEEADELAKWVQGVKTALDNGLYQKATQDMRFTLYLILSTAGNIDFANILNRVSSSFLKEEPGLHSNSYNTEYQKLYKLMNGPVKEALNLNVTWDAQIGQVFDNLLEDHMKPVTHIVEQLLNETTIKVQIVTGQLDLLVNTPGTVQWVDNLNWYGSSTWKHTLKKVLSVDGITEGFHKVLDRFSLVWVNRAGQRVPADNPAAMEVILNHLMN